MFAFFGSQIELAGSLLVLMGNEANAGVRQLFRSFLEAYAQFKLLDSAPATIISLEYDDCVRTQNLLEGVIRVSPKIKRDQRTKSLLSDNGKRLSELRKQNPNLKPLEPSEKFRLAGLESLYSSVYVPLCSDVHCNLRTIASHHFEQEDGSAPLSAVLYRDFRIDQFKTLIQGASDCLTDAVDISNDKWVPSVQKA